MHQLRFVYKNSERKSGSKNKKSKKQTTGGVAEWINATALNPVERDERSVSSNLTPTVF